MDVRHLHYLTEVAKHKNFTRTSEKHASYSATFSQ